MRLINEKTGLEVKVGDELTTFRNEKVTLLSWREPHKPGSTGRIYVHEEGVNHASEFFPGVCGCKFVDE